MKRICYLAAALGLAVSIFLFDALSPLEGAIAVLYVIVILLAARTDCRIDILFAGLLSVALTIAAYAWAHDFVLVGASEVRALVSLSAIAIVTTMALRNHAATETLADQARLLDLSHDMIFVRDLAGKDKILEQNRGRYLRLDRLRGARQDWRRSAEYQLCVRQGRHRLCVRGQRTVGRRVATACARWERADRRYALGIADRSARPCCRRHGNSYRHNPAKRGPRSSRAQRAALSADVRRYAYRRH